MFSPIKHHTVHFNYHLIEKMVAGIVLHGWEVKPILSRKVDLNGAHITIKHGEVFLVNARIDPGVNSQDHDATKDRKLLLSKKEISRLIGAVQEDGKTIVPVSLIQVNGKFKLEIALAKGKKFQDKREDIKNRDIERNIARMMKN